MSITKGEYIPPVGDFKGIEVVDATAIPRKPSFLLYGNYISNYYTTIDGVEGQYYFLRLKPSDNNRKEGIEGFFEISSYKYKVNEAGEWIDGLIDPEFKFELNSENYVDVYANAGDSISTGGCFEVTIKDKASGKEFICGMQYGSNAPSINMDRDLYIVDNGIVVDFTANYTTDFEIKFYEGIIPSGIPMTQVDTVIDGSNGFTVIDTDIVEHCGLYWGKPISYTIRDTTTNVTGVGILDLSSVLALTDIVTTPGVENVNIQWYDPNPTKISKYIVGVASIYEEYDNYTYEYKYSPVSYAERIVNVGEMSCVVDNLVTSNDNYIVYIGLEMSNGYRTAMVNVDNFYGEEIKMLNNVEITGLEYEYDGNVVNVTHDVLPDGYTADISYSIRYVNKYGNITDDFVEVDIPVNGTIPAKIGDVIDIRYFTTDGDGNKSRGITLERIVVFTPIDGLVIVPDNPLGGSVDIYWAAGTDPRISEIQCQLSRITKDYPLGQGINSRTIYHSNEQPNTPETAIHLDLEYGGGQYFIDIRRTFKDGYLDSWSAPKVYVTTRHYFTSIDTTKPILPTWIDGDGFEYGVTEDGSVYVNTDSVSGSYNQGDIYGLSFEYGPDVGNLTKHSEHLRQGAQASIILPLLPEGYGVMRVRGVDASGNESDEYRDFTIKSGIAGPTAILNHVPSDNTVVITMDDTYTTCDFASAKSKLLYNDGYYISVNTQSDPTTILTIPVLGGDLVSGYVLDISKYSGETLDISIRRDSNGKFDQVGATQSLVVDPIELSHISAGGLDGNLSVIWVSAGAVGVTYDVKYKLVTDTVYTDGALDVNGSTYELTGLMSGSSYDILVEAKELGSVIKSASTIGHVSFIESYTDLVCTVKSGPSVSKLLSFKVFDEVLDITVDWGDGSDIETFNADNLTSVFNIIVGQSFYDVSHEYATSGTYDIKVTGVLRGLSHNLENVPTTTIPELVSIMPSEYGAFIINTPYALYHYTGPVTPADFLLCGDISFSLYSLPWASISTFTYSLVNKMQGIMRYVSNNSVAGFDVSRLTSMAGLFEGCSNFNQSLATWDVSKVTDMSRMFYGCRYFDQNLSSWATTNVTNMSYMFYGCYMKTIQGVGSWDVSNVTNMAYMFYDCRVMNQNLSGWDVSKVTDMRYMFYNCDQMNPAITTWVTSNVTNMSYMFKNIANFNANISAWDVSKVTSMREMFYYCTNFNQSLATWDVSKVTDMSNMFYRCTNFNGDLSTWVPSSVTSMRSMFSYAASLNQDLSAWDVSSVTDMAYMFSYASGFNGNLNAWLTANVTDMSYMFQNCSSFNGDVSGWETTNVSDMNHMFYQCSVFIGTGVSGWDTSNVSDMSFMFHQCLVFNQDLSLWNTSKVTSMSNMLNNCSIFETTDLSGWDVSKVTDMSNMFYRCSAFNGSLVGWDMSNIIAANRMLYQAYTFNGDVSNWVLGANTNLNQAFELCSAFTGIGIETWNTSNATNISGIIYDCGNFNGDVSGWDTSNVTNMSAAFYRCTVFNRDLSGWDVSKVTNMSNMFHGCNNFNQDLSSWVTSNVTNMSYMFSYARTFNQNLSTWDVSKVTDMSRMFDGSNEFNGDISNWITTSLITIDNIFSSCYEFNQDLSSWDVSNVTSMSNVFTACYKFNQPLSAWDVSKVTTFSNMFSSCYEFNQDLSAWDTSSLTYLRTTFKNCKKFNQDLSTWDVSKVTDMYLTFSGCYEFNGDVTNWVTTTCNQMTQMFKDARSFNQDISGWQFINANNNMSQMFKGAWLFSQDMSTWNKPNNTNVAGMFDQTNMTEAQILALEAKGFTPGWVPYEYLDKQSIAIIAVGPNASNIDQDRMVSLVESKMWGVKYGTVTSNSFTTGINYGVRLIDNNDDTMDIDYTIDTNSSSKSSSLDSSLSLFSLSNCEFNGAFITKGTVPLSEMAVIDDNRYPITFVESGELLEDVDLTVDRIYIAVPPGCFVGPEVVDANVPTTKTRHIRFGVLAPEIDVCPRTVSVVKSIATPATDLTIDWSGDSSMVGITSVITNVYSVDWSDGYMNSVNSDIVAVTPVSATTPFGTNTIEVTLSDPSLDAFVEVIYVDGDGKHSAKYTRIIKQLIPARYEDDLRSVVGAGVDCSTIRITSSAIKNLDGLFEGLTTFDQDISSWDVSNVTSMERMFKGCAAFNQDISSWDVSKVSNMNEMFSGCTNFNQDISGWVTTGLYYMYDVIFNTPALTFDILNWNINNVASINAVDAAKFIVPGEVFITRWQTTGVDEVITLPTDAVVVPNCTIDWGDGSGVDTVNALGAVTHTYAIAGVYDVTITGTFDGFDFAATSTSASKILNVLQWGTYVRTANISFKNCTKLVSVGLDILNFTGQTIWKEVFYNCVLLRGGRALASLDTSLITDMSYMLYNCEKFNQDLNDWDVSSVTDMSFMFRDSDIFNGSVAGWDVSNVTTMSNMFYSCDAFNQDLSSWVTTNVSDMSYMFALNPWYLGTGVSSFDVSKVTSFSNMFNGCRRFNADLSGWLTPALLYTTKMFYNCYEFDSDLTSWDMSNVLSTEEMFYACYLFKGTGLDGWVTSNVTSMRGMFYSCNVLNANLATWDVGLVTDMYNMFAYGGFNGDISLWNTESVTNMGSMFSGLLLFNSDISDWDVTKVLDMGYMFRDCPIFNQPIGKWIISSIVQMRYFLYGAKLFNQDLSSWDVSGLSTTNKSGMISNTPALETVNMPVGV